MIVDMDFYHVLNRGVDKRKIVMNDQDRKRFVADLFAMNNSLPVGNMNYHFARSMDIGRPYRGEERKKLVQIHGWGLMDNHYHLLISEEVENGLSQFLKKLNMGYAKYFNERYKRSGALFQGKTKKVLIEHAAQFNYILHYIHLNPLDYLKGAQNWRIHNKDTKGDTWSTKSVLEYLSKYRWSSYLDYIGTKNFPEIVTTSEMSEGPAQYRAKCVRYLSAAAENRKEFDSAVTFE